MKMHVLKKGVPGSRKTIGIFPLCAVLIICCFVFAKQSYAHKVNIFAYAEDGRIHAEGYFVDGSKCKNSRIEVIDDKSGEKLAEGYTDDNGQYVVDIPRATSFKLILHAGTGHQNEYVLKEDEVKEALPQKKDKEKEEEKAPEQGVKDPQVSETQKAHVEPKAGQGEALPRARHKEVAAETPLSCELDAAVEKVVDRKLQPVMRILLNLQEKSAKPGLTEILGGIGYIIGILGIVAYFKGRAGKP